VFRSIVRTDVGTVRARNEDASHVDPAGRFALLADGMGGHKAGDVASSMAVDIVRTELVAGADAMAAFAAAPTPRNRGRVHRIVERAIRFANAAIRERGRLEPDKRGMGTTLEVAVVLGAELIVAHVGDSRTYLVRDGAIAQLTEDHTVAQMMRRAGTWDEAEVAGSPLRSALSNALGLMTAFRIDHIERTLRPGDRVLVCSDGLYEYFRTDELAAVLGSAPDLDTLVDEARVRGGHDNITGILLEIEADIDGEAVTDPGPARTMSHIAPRA
jgi:protein phosphatase